VNVPARPQKEPAQDFFIHKKQVLSTLKFKIVASSSVNGASLDIVEVQYKAALK
jgi:hypothetical protein